MGRPARRLTGVVGVLSAALVFVALPSAGATQQTVSVSPSATKTVGAAAAKPKVTAKPLSARAAKAAVADVDVDLPRPVRGETAVRLLGDDVDEAAALNEMTADELVGLLRSDASAWVDSKGTVLYKDAVAPAAPVGRVAAASVPLDQTFTLHSQLGSRHTIFLDFNGASVSASRWQTEHPDVPTTQPAWDPSGNGDAFDDSERTSIQAIWASVAEDFAPFDVDVTTADPGPAAINRSSSGDGVYGSHVVISPSTATRAAICQIECGGAAYRNAFGATDGGAGGDGYGYQQPAWVFPDLLGPDSPKQIAESVSHEVGHQLGLVDDGNAASDRDSGHGAWAPIMGTGYDRPISQWSKGDYPDATNHEDDVETIRSVLGLRPDAAGSSVAQAGEFPSDPSYITARSDVDVYLLGTCTGPFSVSADPVDAQADLDIKLTLLSATGTTVATADPPSAQASPTTASGMDASITRTSASGTYYVAVDGTGNGPWSTGYDDYGSLGAYTMAKTGSCDGVAPTGVPSKANGLAASPDPLTPSVRLSWTAPTTPGAGGAVTGYLLTRSGSDDYVQVPASTTSYTWTGLAFGTGYTFTVTPLNAKGVGAASSVATTTSTGVVVPGAPRGVTAAWNPVPQTAVVAWSPPPSTGSDVVEFYALYLDGALYNYYPPSTTGLQFAGLSPGVTYTFGVAAVSSAGTGATTTATVAIPARAANDDFAQRATLSGVSGTVTANNTESSEESGEPAPTAGRAGSGKSSVWYSWTAPASGPVTMTTTSSVTDRDTTLDVFTGSSVGTLSRVVGNDEPTGGGHLAAVTFDATAGSTYAIGVNGYRTPTGVGQFGLSWVGSAIGAKSTTTGLTAVVSDSVRSVKLTAAVTASFGTPTGHVDFYDGNTKIGDDLLNRSSPSPTLTVTDLPRGDHDFSAKFVPSQSDLFAGSTSPDRTVTISASTTATTLQGSADAQLVTLTAEVDPASGVAAGTVRFRDGSTLVGTGTVAYGRSTIVLTDVAPGPHVYTATFVPSDLERYVGSTSATTSVTVAAYPPAKATTTTLSGQVSGRTVSLVATVAAAGATPVGTVQVSDGDTVVDTATLSAGSTTLTLDDLTRGTHELSATFVPADPTAFASSTSAATSLEVAATPTATALTTSLSGRTVTFETSVSPSSEGSVQISEGDVVLDTVTLVDGAGHVVLDVAVGTHHYTATYVPTDDLRVAGSTSPTQDVVVGPAATATALGSSVTLHKVVLTATVTSVIDAAGSVTFREGDDIVGSDTVSEGVATATVAAVATGAHTYTATFTPADAAEQAGSVSPNHTATVDRTPTTTGLSTSVDGQDVTLTGSVTTVAGALAGKLEFREDSTLVGTVPLTSGSAELELSDVAPGAHSYVATFVPTGTTHAVSSSAATADVQGATSTTLTISVDDHDVILKGAVSGTGTPGGTVEFHEGANHVGTASLSGGEAAITVSDVADGAHTYIATFVPTVSSVYVGSHSAAQTIDVDLVATTTTLSAAASGQSVTLTSAVSAASGTLTGSVQFREGSTVVGTTTLSAGAASAIVSNVTPGVHSYSARFVPTGGVHDGSTSPTQSATVLGTTSTALTTNVAGRTVTATAVVTSDGTTPAGSVAFYRDGTLAGTVTLTSGTAVYTATSVVPGTYNYAAVYTPSSAVSSGSSSAASIASVGTVSSTTALEAAVDDRTVTLDAAVTVTDGSAAGTVRFRDGETLVGVVDVASGAASLTLDDVTPGEHSYAATFVPTEPSVYVGSDSSEKTVTAAPIGTTTALLATASGQSVTLAATPAAASGRLAGEVEFREGTTLLDTVTLRGSTVVLTRTDVAPGSHTYTATFVPTDPVAFAPSTSSGGTVTAAAHSSATDLDVTVEVRTVTLDATVAAGSLETPGNVVFRDGNSVVGTIALDDGAAQLVLPLVAPGSHRYTATFEATDSTTYTDSVSPSRTVGVLPIVTTTGLTATPDDQTLELTAHVTGDSGVPAGSVVFRESGRILGSPVAVVAGSAVLNLDDVVPGDHTYTATFVPTDPATYRGSASSDRSATVDLVETQTGFSATVDGSTVELEADLDPAAAGRVVFRDGTTVVGKVTLDGGEATFVLTDVAPGDHRYTAAFEPIDTATYAGSISPDRPVTVKIPTTTELTAGAVQGTVSLNATVTGSGSPAGDVEFREGSTLVGTVPVASGAATLTLDEVSPGSHGYRATFVPATPAKIAGSVSAVRTTTVAPTVTTTVLSTHVDDHSVTLDVEVTSAGGGSPAGTVDFRDGSTVVGTTPLLAGAASMTLTDVAPGDHAYRAFFTPNDAVTYGFSSTAPGFTKVAPVATDTDLDVTADGRIVSFATEVTSDYAVPAGSVIIREGSKILATVDLTDGASHAELTGVDPGPHAYTAAYVPAQAGTHVGSTSPERSVTVAMPTETGLTATASVRAVTLRATVTPLSGGTPAGQIEFQEGTDIVGTVAVDHDGAASITLTDVTPGQHTYTATFVPTDAVTFAGSASPSKKVTVVPIVTTTTLDTEVDVRTVTLSAAVTGASDTPTGEVEFRDGTDLVGTIDLDDGAASTTLTNVTPGEHSYTATFVPSDPVTFARSVASGDTITVDPIVTTTALDTQVAVRTVTLTATVTGPSGTPTGEVEFLEGDSVVGTATLDAGAASVELTGVTPGEHTYRATYVPASAVTYAGSDSSNGTVTVDPIVTTIQLTAQADGRTITLEAAIAAVSDSPTGQVEFREGTDVVGTIDVDDGAAATTLTNVTPGDYTFTATFVPTDPVTFAGSDSGDEAVTVGRVATTTDLVVTVTGQSVTLTATPASTSGTPAGDVEFLEGSTLLDTVPLTGGSAALRLPEVTPGPHTYTARFVPAGSIDASSSASQQVTVPNATTTALTVAADGGQVTLSALVTSDAGVPTGAVEFYDDDTLLGGGPSEVDDGLAGLTVDNVLGGEHSYRAVFVPDDVEEFMTSAAPASVTVDPTVTTIDLVAARKPDSRSVVLTADIWAAIGTPAGRVQFSDGDTLLGDPTMVGGDGKATTTVTSVTTGVHEYSAVFVPDSTATYAGSGSAPAPLTMAVSTTTTEIAVSNLGATVTVQATVTSADGVPTGTVELTQDGQPVPQSGQLDAGGATVTLVDVAPGEHTYMATYLPENSSYESSVSSAEAGRGTVTVPASATATSLNAVAVGRTVTLSAAVTSPGRTPAGSVVFSDGLTQFAPVAVAGGAASLTLPGVAVGPHTYSALFVPANPTAFETSSSATRQVTVAATATTTSLAGSVRGTTATLRVTVAGADGLAPAGSVRVLVGSTSVGQVQLVDGRATLVVPEVAVGRHSYRATFVPATGDFAASSSSAVALTVRPVASKTNLTAPAKAKAKSRPTIKVKVQRGGAPAAGKVLLRYGAKKVTLKLKSGRASFRLPKAKEGKLKVTASYLGNATTAKSAASRSIKVTK